MGQGFVRIAVVCLAFSLAACANTTVKKAATAAFDWSTPDKKVVLVEPDVVLGSLNAIGVMEPRADWTQSAKTLITQDVTDFLSPRSIALVNADHLTDPHEIQVAKLHGVVGQAIRIHLYLEGTKLPSKGNALDWTLGPGAVDLRSHYGADYALFVFVRDSYTSSGRALMMLGAAMLGVSIQGGIQYGFASLVDLRTGNIVWFNQILNNNGDLRTAKPAKAAVADLLRGFPL